MLSVSKHEVRPDGARLMNPAIATELGDRALRVVTLDDGETVHNAFADRSFRREQR